MRAAIYHEFGGPIAVETVDDPACPAAGVVIRVRANGLCRSDWHGWQGHDPMVRLPHVPGHELAGTVVEVGPDCHEWSRDARVTVPFALGCGTCPACSAGQHQVCHRAEQPGFSGWGGLGLSAVMIARAAGARVVAVDIEPAALELARSLGAAVTIDARGHDDVAAAVRDATGGGAHVSLDALGHPETCANSIRGLRTQGRHVQAGLFGGREPTLPMDDVIGRELELLGTHGMAAHRFPALLDLIADGRLDPARLITRRIVLDQVPEALMRMDAATGPGMTVMETN